MFDTILRLLYYLLFFGAPLIMTSVTSELFEFNKMIFIYIIAILVLFVWLAKMIRSTQIILKKTLFDIPLLIFIGSQIISTVFSIDRHTSLFGYYGRFNGGLVSILAYAVLYFGFTSNFFSGTDNLGFIKKLLRVSLVSSFIVILWGLPGKLGHDLSCLLFTGQWNNSCWTSQFHPDERMFSTLGQPNWFGAYLAIHFFIGLYFLVSEYLNKKKTGFFARTMLYGYLFLNFSSILFTRSRSALVSVLIGLVFLIPFSIYWLGRSLKLQKKELIVGILLILIPLIVFKTGYEKVDRYLRLPSFTKQKTVQPTNQQTAMVNITESFDIRTIVWKGAVELANRYPFFGTGVETFAYSYYFVRPAAHNLTSEWDFLYNKAHNEYLNYAATTGYVGLVSYLTMILVFVILAILAIRKTKGSPEVRFLYGSLLLAYLSILITNFFGFSTTTINLFFYIIPAIIVPLHYGGTEISISIAKPVRNHPRIYTGIVALITLFLLISSITYFLADVYYAQADVYSRTGDYQNAASLLMKAIKLRYEHVYEDKLSYVLANLAVVASYEKQQQLSGQLVQIADAYNKKSIAASPKNVLYWKTRAKNEYLFYQISLDRSKIMKGIDALRQAEKLSPTDPKIPYSLAIFNSLLYDEEKNQNNKKVFETASLEEIDRTISLKPDYRDGYLLKGQLLKKYGMKKEAKQVFEYILNTINPSDDGVKKELQQL